MTEHAIELTQDDDGWDMSRCDCGWVSPPCPDPDTAAGFWGDQLTASQCAHGIYHHGCPSCDAIDPEEGRP